MSKLFMPIDGENLIKVMETYDTLVYKNACCPCGVDHRAGKQIITPPKGKGWCRKGEERFPTKIVLYVGGLPPNVLHSYVEEVFRHIEPSVNCTFVKTEEADHPHAYAFITVADVEAAVRVYHAIDGHKLEGRTVTVRDSRV